ncbi:MAG: type II toxin-antitoxin system HicA family toxin [Firmicutes bacterium]|nr:type II toxin-antitoxin system HicA family toxin [Bacillota bacterium]
MTGKQMVKLFRQYGWIVKSVEGSHYNMIHPDFRGKVTIPYHTKELKKGLQEYFLKKLKEVG